MTFYYCEVSSRGLILVYISRKTSYCHLGAWCTYNCDINLPSLARNLLPLSFENMTNMAFPSLDLLAIKPYCQLTALVWSHDYFTCTVFA